jgi:hypothetical protein
LHELRAQEHSMNTKPGIITDARLDSVTGGSWDDLVNVGRAIANGGANTLNFFHDHPVSLGAAGTFSVGGDRVTKPFQHDPLSQIGKIPGRAVPAKQPRKR